MKSVVRLLEDINELFAQIQTELKIHAKAGPSPGEAAVGSTLAGACQAAHAASAATLRLARALCPK